MNDKRSGENTIMIHFNCFRFDLFLNSFQHYSIHFFNSIFFDVFVRILFNVYFYVFST